MPFVATALAWLLVLNHQPGTVAGLILGPPHGGDLLRLLAGGGFLGTDRDVPDAVGRTHRPRVIDHALEVIRRAMKDFN